MQERESSSVPTGMGLSAHVLTPRILVVDDDPSILRLFSTLISRSGFGFPTDTAGSLEAARKLISGSVYDIVFLDLVLPDGLGTRLLEEKGRGLGEAIVIIVSGQQELDTAVEVLRKGAYDYICKPFTIGLFDERFSRALEEWRSRRRFRYYQENLESLVNTMIQDVRRSQEQIEKVYDMTVSALGAALDLRDPETEEHCQRVAENSVRLGRVLGPNGVEPRNLRWGAYLHDIGKIGIPENILSKPSALSAEEAEVVKTHPLLGYRLIARIEFLREATEVVLYHHEKYDGSGYPYRLKGKAIPISARIFSVIDAMDAMTHDRPYRGAMPFDAFRTELERESGRHFDPEIVSKVISLPQDYWSMVNAKRDEGRAPMPQEPSA